MKKCAWLSMCVLAGTSLAWSQMGSDKLCEVNLVTPKPGAAKQLEDGRKRHNQFHVAQKDKFPVTVWSISSGPYTGQYLMTTCGITWKDMDRPDFDKLDQADIERTMTPFVANTQTGYYVRRQEMSTAPAEDNTPTPKMLSITHFFLKPEGVIPFMDAVKRINQAIAKTQYPSKPSTWYQLANGGEGPHFVLVSERNSWADMQGPEKTMAQMLSEAYGADDKTLQTLREATRYNLTEMLEYRADLSYNPPK